MAIAAFAEQNYPPVQRELLLVSENDIDCPLVEGGGPIRFIHRPGASTLGELRNAGLDEARGELITQWDDDDYHPPDRIGTQVGGYLQRPGVPHFFKRQLCYSWDTDTAFIRQYDTTFIHGSILHPRTQGRYPHQRKEEDSVFLGNWSQHAVLENDPALYVRFEHGHNTWTRDHILRQYAQPWALGKWHLCKDHADLLAKVVARYRSARPAVATAQPALP